MNLGSAPVRYRRRAGAGRARCRPAARDPRPVDQGRRRRRRRGPAADLRAPALGRGPRRGRPARRLRLLCARPRHGRAPRRRHLAPGRDRRMGRAGGVGLGPRLVAPGRLQSRVRDLPAGRSLRAAARASRRRALLGARGRSRLRPAAGGRAVAQGRRNTPARKLLRPGRPRNASAWTRSCRRIRSSASTRRSTNCPTSSAPWSWPRSASPRSPRRCFATRPRSALPTEHHALIQLAKQLDLPAAQLGSRTTASRARVPTRPTAIPTPAGRPLERLAGRSRARLRPHRPGIRLPPHRGQHGGRGRPDAGAARSPRS